MANSFFKFKQFTVHQDKCAMKVCTDACLFGAWIASMNDTFFTSINNALDIGSGTGLLSLMFVQKNKNVVIDAVEIDEAAANQAMQNFNTSPWKERLRIINNDVLKISLPHTYQFIFSNPPFFENDLKSNDAKRNIALHSADLNLHELLNVIINNITLKGKFAILLPYHRSLFFEQLCLNNNFYLQEKVLIKATPHHHFFRCMLLFSSTKTATIEKEIIIQNQLAEYSSEFKELLSDYYLYL